MPMMAQTTSLTVDDLLKVEGLEPVANGQTMYYLRNVGTGLSLCYGGEWGTHCIESQSPHPIILEDNNDGSTVSIGSLVGYLDSDGLWMDFLRRCPSKDDPNYETKYDHWSAGELVSKWKLVEVDGHEGQYYLEGDGGRVLASIGHRAGLLALKSKEETAFERWIFTSGEHMKESVMPMASLEMPVDVSMAIRGGGYDMVDDYDNSGVAPAVFEAMQPYHHKYWNNYSAYSKANTSAVSDVRYMFGYEWNPLDYHYCGVFCGAEAAYTVDYKMTLPPGLYRMTFQGFYSIQAAVASSMSPKVVVSTTGSTMVNTPISLSKGLSSNTYDDHRAAGTQFHADESSQEHEAVFYLPVESEIQILVDKNKSETLFGANPNNRIYLDNFCLYYAGTNVEGLPDPVLPPIEVTEDKSGYEMIYVLQEGSFFGIPYSYYLPMYVSWSDIANYLTEQGKEMPVYISPTWNGTLETLLENVLEGEELTKAQQEYQAYAEKVAEFNKNAQGTDNSAIFRNQLQANVNEFADNLSEDARDVFYDKLSDYLKSENDEYVVDKDKVSDKVKYYDAIEKMLEAYEWAKVTDSKNTGSGNITGADDHIDFSGAIFNHTFDLFQLDNNDRKNKPKGWTYYDAGDTQVAFNAGGFTASGGDGMYLFNTWGNNAAGTSYFGGTPIHQTVTDLPAGTYLVSALMTSDSNNKLCVFAGSSSADYKYSIFSAPDEGGTVFDDYGKKVVVNTGGELYLGVAGAKDDGNCTFDKEGRWYKCDNFRLEYLPGGVLTLKETAERITNIVDEFVGARIIRSINSGNWSTLVLPFDMPCPDNWEVETLNVVDQYDGDIRLTFSSIYPAGWKEGDDAPLLKAGVPYIVRVGEALSTISANDVNVNTTLLIPATKSSAEYDVEFVPVYTNGFIPASELQKNENGELVKDGNNEYIPTGTQYYFINGSGKLKRCVYENYNAIKGFRAYFKVTPKTAEARNALRSLSMRTSEETDIENVATEEVKVIGIYDVNGIRLSEMKPGINILRMNNGTTKKVMVK